MLAQVYAAESLLQLNKINEAIEHLDLNSLQVRGFGCAKKDHVF